MLELVARLASRDAARSEATVQADVRQLLLRAKFSLDNDDLRDIRLESPAGEHRRIDVEVGATVIEVKRDLRRGRVRLDAIEQLGGYVANRQAQTGQRYVGILTDGAEWRCYHLSQGSLDEVSHWTVSSAAPGVDGLVVWLDGVMATAQEIPATAQEIRFRLGAGSSSFALDLATLRELYRVNHRNPSVTMKRRLWAKLLGTALGTQFEDTDQLFLEHTFLVNSAEIIAHALLRFDVRGLQPGTLLSGAKFDEAGIYGVVESDFFDWVLEVAEGEAFVRSLARRLARFAWADVEHDVLKVLYESIIGRDTRKRLGEYYTPDWLAEKMVDVAVSEPLAQCVLDPSCGSGTFLFHAVRRYLDAAEGVGQSIAASLDTVSRRVFGMDLHPVAVALARVTYLLAIGRNRLLDPTRGSIRIPVFLGDSLQWQRQREDLWTLGQLVVETDTDGTLFAEKLRFPSELLTDARVFDELVEALASLASRRAPRGPVPSLSGLFRRLAIPADAQAAVAATFKTMCRLHDEGRDHIWGYYIRNLARPVWLAQPANQVDILIGNPPWLAYRNMPEDMQIAFRLMSESRKLWAGARYSTQQDLSALFVARCIQLYLAHGGSFAFVMPNAVLDRAPYSGFRAADFPDASRPVKVRFDMPWDLRRIRPHFFPRGAAVVRGARAAAAGAMPVEVEFWSGRVEDSHAAWEEVEEGIEREQGQARLSTGAPNSPYAARFINGATVFPRLLLTVEKRPQGPLGVPAGRVAVASRRSAYEKEPWKSVSSLDGVLETEFVRPVYLGECVLPYRTVAPVQAVIPWDRDHLMDGQDSRLDLYPGLAKWWRCAEQLWEEHRSTQQLSLRDRLDYHRGLSNQFPIQPLRVAYSKSGMHLAVALVEDERALVENTLYWGTPGSLNEAHYLLAVLNSAVLTRLVRPLMPYGKDERHFDRHLWQLPIPGFDSANAVHMELAALGAAVKEEVANVELRADRKFVSHRRRIREFLKNSSGAQRIERLVQELVR